MKRQQPPSLPGSLPLSRRQILLGTAAAATALTTQSRAAQRADLNQASLAALAAEKGLLLAASFAVHEMDASYGKAYAQAYSDNVGGITSELCFKMGMLRPTADKLDFGPADRLTNFAQQNGMKLRAHTLIWNDALPEWVHRLRAGEIELLMDAHLLSIMERYRGRVWAWDVVNEPIGPWDKLPGNLRNGPFYAAMGEGYIARAFRAARGYDPMALLVLNEAQTETADGNGQIFRDSLLALLKRLKAEDVPIDAIGLQSHLRSDRPYDMPRFVGFLDEIAALGYAIHITEFDVNDVAYSGSIAARDQAVAKLYRDFLTPVLAHKAVKVLTFWQLADRNSWLTYGAKEKGMKRMPRPLPLDDDFQRKPAWYALAEVLKGTPPR